MQNEKIKKALKKIIPTYPQSLRSEVAAEALSYGDDIKNFFSDFLNYGGQSGMVGKLIYYCDTHKFYDTHYYEVEELREELEMSFGECLQAKGDLKNWFAWMAFEETARTVAEELEL